MPKFINTKPRYSEGYHPRQNKNPMGPTRERTSVAKIVREFKAASASIDAASYRDPADLYKRPPYYVTRNRDSEVSLSTESGDTLVTESGDALITEDDV